jgi:GTP-binding protein
LNRVLARAWERRKPRARGGRIGKIYFGSQVSTHPPTIVLSVNDPALFDDNWRRYLLHELQAKLPYSEIPVHLRFQARTKSGPASASGRKPGPGPGGGPGRNRP